MCFSSDFLTFQMTSLLTKAGELEWLYTKKEKQDEYQTQVLREFRDEIERGGVNFDEQSEEGQSCLLIFSARGYDQLIKLFVENKANCNLITSQTSGSWSPLMYGCLYGNVKVVIELLKGLANPFLENTSVFKKN